MEIKGLPAEYQSLPIAEAKHFWQRAVGLIGKRRAEYAHALLFKECRSIHTLGMLAPIDLFFISDSGEVVETKLALSPFQICIAKHPEARHTLEIMRPSAR